MAPDTLERSLPPLKDPSLLRQQCYFEGKWQNADSGATHPVLNPATGKLIGTVAGHWARRRRSARLPPRTPHGQRGATRPRRSAARSCASGSS